MTVEQKIIKNKLGLMNLAEELGNVSKACRVMGFSRDTFYRYRELMDKGGIDGLLDVSRRKANPKNRVDEEIEKHVIDYGIENPAFGHLRASNELRKQGVFISPSGIRSVWLRHDMETMQKRLKIVDGKQSAGMILTEQQLQALERKKQDDEACGEIETHHPGYLGSQDTFYVGNLKGVGRIYQQTFVDTYSKVAHAKLYVTKRPIAAADLLNDRVIPFFETNGIFLLRILTDRGTEYCGIQDKHDYQLFLAIHAVEHTKTKARHPQTNGICERFHKTILNEFYQTAFRTKIYSSIDQLQADLDMWVMNYNLERTHQGKHCNGRTPMETFLDGIEVYRQKTWTNSAELNLN
jgi:transposase InsO family protein